MAAKANGVTGQAKFPAKLRCLFKPLRYKISHGGRGSGKSWSIARALLILGAKKPLRILCAREVQKSLKDSVYKLLVDQIKALGLSGKYDVLESTISGKKNGTEILFSGLSSVTAAIARTRKMSLKPEKNPENPTINSTKMIAAIW